MFQNLVIDAKRECPEKRRRTYSGEAYDLTLYKSHSASERGQMDRASASRAHSIVAKAVAEGLLPDLRKAEVWCVDCGNRATEYDHRSYKDPLKVDPVCHSCNVKRGRAADSVESNWNIQNIPRALANRVKAEAALRGESIREYVLEAVAERISRSNRATASGGPPKGFEGQS